MKESALEIREMNGDLQSEQSSCISFNFSYSFQNTLSCSYQYDCYSWPGNPGSCAQHNCPNTADDLTDCVCENSHSFYGSCIDKGTYCPRHAAALWWEALVIVISSIVGLVALVSVIFLCRRYRYRHHHHHDYVRVDRH